MAASNSQLPFITGFGIATLMFLGIDFFYPQQAMLQAVPVDYDHGDYYVRFEIETYRASREHAYVIPQFTLPTDDGTDDGACEGYSEHWYGLCVPR